MGDYLNLISTDLFNIIFSYIDYENVLKFVDTYYIDYNILFQLRFPKLYHQNINKYDVKNIYLDLLRLSNKYHDFIIKSPKPTLVSNPLIISPLVIVPNMSLPSVPLLTIKSPNVTYSSIISSKKPIANIGKINIDEYYGDFYEEMKIHKDSIKYLMMNNEIPFESKLIANVDDVELFNNKIIGNEFDYFSLLVRNSHNILKYLYNNKHISEMERIFSYYDIAEAYENFHIDIETTKILFKHLNLDLIKIINILGSYDSHHVNWLESFEYIINNIDQKVINDQNIFNAIIETLTSSLKSENSYIKFKLIYDKFNNFFNQNNMILLYNKIIESISYGESIKINIELLKIISIVSHDKRIEEYLS